MDKIREGILEEIVQCLKAKYDEVLWSEIGLITGIEDGDIYTFRVNGHRFHIEFPYLVEGG